MSYVKPLKDYDESYEPYVRELLSYEVLCSHSSQIVFDQYGMPNFQRLPSVFHWSRIIEWPFCLSEGNFQSHHKVLDIGSHWGCLKYAIASRVQEVVANDHDPEVLRCAKETSDKFGFTNIKWDCSDLRKLPFPDSYFDRVVNISVLEHIAGFDHVGALQELIRVLKPGGKLLMTCDIRVNGYDTGEFCIDLRKFKQMLEYLKLEYPSGQQARQARIDAVDIVVAMVVFDKPENWEP